MSPKKQRKNISKRSSKAGLPPGTLMFLGERKTEQSTIEIIEYDAQYITEKKTTDYRESFPYKDSEKVAWLNIYGLHDIEMIKAIGHHYEIHNLILEDLLNTDQRPKIEILGHKIFIVLKMLIFDEKEQKIETEQISLVLGNSYVLTFQEKEGDIFDPLRSRLRNAAGRLRNEKSDYLAYAILDIVVDNYFIILEKLGEIIENYEEILMSNSEEQILNKIYTLKREILFLRKSVWPLREVISKLERSETEIIGEKTTPYMRDLYDHTIQVIDTVETYRDMITGLLDLYLTTVSNKMNEVMKVLTIIATIFIPLTFIAGVYGMNFENMPELGWKYAYHIVMATMLVVAIAMLYYFRRKKWL